MSGLSPSASVPCWVRHPGLLLGSLRPSVARSVVLLNRNLPRATPWHTGMTTAGRAKLLLGKREGGFDHEPWEASSPEEFLTRLHIIFQPCIVDQVAEQLLRDEAVALYDFHGRLSVTKPYNNVAFTEHILVAALTRVEEAHAGEAMRRQRSRMASEAYDLPAELSHRRVPEWVKNPALLYPDCRGFPIEVIKQINADMPEDGDWWRDDHMGTVERVRVVTKRIREMFHRHIGQPGGELHTRVSFPCKPGVLAVDDVTMWAATTNTHKTASLAGSMFRRHVAVEIKDEVMRFDYTVPGISLKDKKRFRKALWDVIRRTMLDIVQRCEGTDIKADASLDTSHTKYSSSLDDSRPGTYTPPYQGYRRLQEEGKGVEAVHCIHLEEEILKETSRRVIPPDPTGKRGISRLPAKMRHTLRSAAGRLSNLVSHQEQALS